jgi:hypothetical protein
VTAKYPVTAKRVTMYDAIDAADLPAHTVKAAGYVNGQWPSYSAIVQRFPAARVRAIDVFGDAWLHASVLDYEEGNVETYKNPDKVRDFVIGRNEFRPQTACIYCNTSDLADIEDYLQGLWHVIWAASWGENGTVGNSLTGTRTAAGNLIVATQLQNAGSYDMSDSLESW